MEASVTLGGGREGGREEGRGGREGREGEGEGGGREGEGEGGGRGWSRKRWGGGRERGKGDTSMGTNSSSNPNTWISSRGDQITLE